LSFKEFLGGNNFVFSFQFFQHMPEPTFNKKYNEIKDSHTIYFATNLFMPPEMSVPKLAKI